MGVPVFFKWLSMRNPKFVVDAHQPVFQAYESGNAAIDNFYVDMNGLIHPSVNPKGQNIKPPQTFQQQCQNIFEYIDKLMNIVRPKKMIYLAIDGVAPRAKMNQQRSRRFRAVLQGDQIKVKKQEIYEKYKSAGAVTPQLDNYVHKKGFNSNLITPGTQFLSSVCQQIRKYISQRLVNHKLWRNLAVIFSDANCPGQGQHKIMDFIRQERAAEDYAANQTHCIYGADADLIMLTLATHQPRFYIIRQLVITANDKWCTACGKRGHYFLDCMRANSIEDQQKVAEKVNAGNIQVQFQFLRVKTVREFLHLYYHKANMNFQYDLQRVIDDFVFLCFFVGNDFLPHIPCLSIRDGGIDILMRVYQLCLAIMPDYLTDSGDLNEESLQIFIKQMTYYEEEIIQEMINKEYNQKLRENNDKMAQNLRKKSDKKKHQDDQNLEIEIDFKDPLLSFKEEVQKLVNPELPNEDYSVFGHNVYTYKQKFYREKFKIKPTQFLELKHNISRSYIEALKWICRYYYKGVASWSWFYPFHYSPFFTDLSVVQTQPFEKGYPFRPFEQLMAVFPAKTSQALPLHLRPLMTSPDSPIADYFPNSFKIDVVGKKFAWLGQVLLPFLDQNRLLQAMGNYQQKLTEQQARRNRFGGSQLFISRFGYLGRQIADLLQIGHSINLTNQMTHEYLQGQIRLNELLKGDQVLHYSFEHPSKRKHKCQLKQTICMGALEDLDEQIISRTDKRAFGGERFVRIIQRVLGKRGRVEFRRNNNQNRGYQQRNYQNRNFQRRQSDRSQKSKQIEEQTFQKTRSGKRRFQQDKQQVDTSNQTGRKRRHLQKIDLQGEMEKQRQEFNK